MTGSNSERPATRELTPLERVENGFGQFDDLARDINPDYEPGDIIEFEADNAGQPTKVRIDSFAFFGQPNFRRLVRVYIRESAYERYVYLARKGEATYTPKNSTGFPVPDADATIALATVLEELLHPADGQPLELRVRKPGN